jgi:hypothetical protein
MTALIAMVAHEANRAYCLAIGDTSQLPWAEAPQWQKDSAIAGVQMHLANPDATPADSHESWLKHKLADGWVYGPVKDAENKQHPCCVPYEDLPAEQKAKDFIFRGAVHAANAALNAAVSDERSRAPKAKGKEPSAPGEVCVTYIGRRQLFVDHLYGSSLTFTAGQARSLPPVLAAKLLRHQDMFKEGGTPKSDDTSIRLSEAQQVQEKQLDEQSNLQDLREAVMNMDKSSLREFAMTNYRQQFLARDTLPEMRNKAIGMIDQYGAI